MKLYVGITDADWFRYLRQQNAEEMNFWRPRATTQFKVLEANELFLFKSRFPENKIMGGAFFVRHSMLPLELAWKAFGEANGMPSLPQFRQKIQGLRRDQEFNPIIGCTILTQPFFLDDKMFIDPPHDWPANIVTGKSFEILPGSEGLRLFEQAQPFFSLMPQSEDSNSEPNKDRYGKEQTIKPRLGQGGFRIMVLDEYSRRCAITGEKTLPVLEAAHIQPYSEKGPHKVSNGILMRSDLHTLFDNGYLTLTKEFHVEVSKRIREEFSNGREYYALHGKKLVSIPDQADNRPDPLFLEWHQNNCYRG
ncbi:MAG: HNH endonuclease [Cyanobacteriota bacterium]